MAEAGFWKGMTWWKTCPQDLGWNTDSGTANESIKTFDSKRMLILKIKGHEIALVRAYTPNGRSTAGIQ
jgi:hypothetical protein